MSFIAETFIFLYVGMDVCDVEKWKMAKTVRLKTTLGVSCLLITLVLLGRAAFVFPLSLLSNYTSSDAERSAITFRHQLIIWWAGLTRGAVSIALAFNQFTVSGVTWDPVHATIITSTIVVVLFTTLVLGVLTKPLVSVLTRKTPDNEQRIPTEDLTHPLLALEESSASGFLKATRSLSILLERPAHTIHFYWRKFDDAYMRPLFGGPTVSP
ncbi:Sodium/hydrogen exchanger 4 [Apostasia shenzhenica]|uniref:Sodium/hydrogen exchanger 4 n=1 Tax=Apostasia shenzhenica TaxID=1088818 RepID=A0A2I0A720_9ASPA|nr:Sodium/hydrogen exchanger 4 [Apostasia shenzhenica]